MYNLVQWPGCRTRQMLGFGSRGAIENRASSLCDDSVDSNTSFVIFKGSVICLGGYEDEGVGGTVERRIGREELLTSSKGN